MLKSKYIKVKVLKRNHSSLIKKYNLDQSIEVGDIVDIPISLIPKGSNYEVEVECYYCNKLLSIPYKRYNKYTEIVNKYSCSSKECSNQKIKDVC